MYNGFPKLTDCARCGKTFRTEHPARRFCDDCRVLNRRDELRKNRERYARKRTGGKEHWNTFRCRQCGRLYELAGVTRKTRRIYCDACIVARSGEPSKADYRNGFEILREEELQCPSESRNA